MKQEILEKEKRIAELENGSLESDLAEKEKMLAQVNELNQKQAEGFQFEIEALRAELGKLKQKQNEQVINNKWQEASNVLLQSKTDLKRKASNRRMTIADFAPKENRRLSVWSGFKLPMPDFGLSTKVETNFGLSPKVETAKKSADSLPTPELSPFIESPSPVRRISHVSSRDELILRQNISISHKFYKTVKAS